MDRDNYSELFANQFQLQADLRKNKKKKHTRDQKKQHKNDLMIIKWRGSRSNHLHTLIQVRYHNKNESKTSANKQSCLSGKTPGLI